MKKKIIIACLIIVLIAIAIISNIDLKNEEEEPKVSLTDAELFKQDYESLNKQINENNQKVYPSVWIPKDNVINYTTIDEALDILKDQTGVIYFGSPSCPWCRNMVSVLLNAANSTGLAQIYYVDTTDIRDEYELDNQNNPVLKKEGAEGYNDLLEALDPILEDYVLETDDEKSIEVGEKRLYVPLVVFVKNGKIIGSHLDTVESQTDPYETLNNEQTEQLFNIYVDYIVQMQDSTCDDSC